MTVRKSGQRFACVLVGGFGCALNQSETFDESTANMHYVDMEERISKLYAVITSKETILTEIEGQYGLRVDEQVRKRFGTLLSVCSIPH